MATIYAVRVYRYGDGKTLKATSKAQAKRLITMAKDAGCSVECPQLYGKKVCVDCSYLSPTDRNGATLARGYCTYHGVDMAYQRIDTTTFNCGHWSHRDTNEDDAA